MPIDDDTLMTSKFATFLGVDVATSTSLSLPSVRMLISRDELMLGGFSGDLLGDTFCLTAEDADKAVATRTATASVEDRALDVRVFG